ncbi:hypothetical protein ABPG72_004074 [Tetrahymena utriculariae]
MDKHKPLGYQYLKKDPLQVKTKTSTKYEHVQKTINSGTTARDVEVKSDKFIAKKKNENFGRISARYLFTLLCLDKNHESIYELINQNNQPEEQIGKFSYDNVSQASYNSRQSGITQTHEPEQKEGYIDQNSFLLLDVRDETEQSTYRIKESVSYPITNFKRDKVIPILYKFKNAADKVIIVYSSDEKQTITAGQTFFEKGYDNIYILNKGIECFALEYPDHIEGIIPDAIKKQSVQTEKKIVSRQASDNKTTMGITKTSSINSKPSTANKTNRTPINNILNDGKENKPSQQKY